jgi:RNA polymerase sigma factor (sigma-70 family)
MTNAKVVAIDAGNHRTRLLEQRDEIVEQHLSLVEGIARSVARTLPSCFDLEDLIGVGNAAMLDLATLYRPGDHGGAPFSAYARKGIRGAILESVRRNKWVEQTRPGLHCIARAGRGGENPNEGGDFVADIPELIGSASLPGHDDAIDAARMSRRLAEALTWLSPPEQRVLRGYYGLDEPTLKAVAERLEVPAGRARELHKSGIEGLRRRFKIAA